MRKAKTDNNQKEIVKALRDIGASVETTHAVGKGFPDLVVGFRGQNFLIEVKGAKGKLTDDQYEWHNEWRGSADIVRSKEQALKAIGAI